MRLDLFLVEKKGVNSRTKAQELIKAGQVVLIQAASEQVLLKSSFMVTDSLFEKIQIKPNSLQNYVSRGGHKLKFAIEKTGVVTDGMNVLDVGQSTGGFTDYLRQNKAKKIVGIDVGHGQLDQSLKSVSNMRSFEGMHVKDLINNVEFMQQVPRGGFDLIVMDISFISITKVIFYLKDLIKIKGEYLFLVKPQFELTAKDLDKNGIVKDVKKYLQVQACVEEQARQHFGSVLKYFPSTLLGKDGNQEFFIYGQKTI